MNQMKIATSPDPTPKIGKVITFYSFKGGVGRSMSLANIAIMLAQWNFRTLIIDWDLEAPGLENFYSEFLPLEKAKQRAGLIDLLLSRVKGRDSNVTPINWKDCILPIRLETSYRVDNYVFINTKLDLLTAGQINDEYYEKVRSFDFKTFYKDHDGGNIIEELRTEWIKEYDFVLIDSRTGVTDIGGVCTVQLPDILVILFTPTQQSLDGVKRVALKAMKAQKELPFERINLMTLPVATRIDNSEYKLTEEWFKKFAAELQEVYAGWLPDLEEKERINFLLNTKVPYISYFSFGEKLPVMEEGSSNPTGMGYCYESLAALLANKLDGAYSLLSDRSKLIEKSSGGIGDVEISMQRPKFANYGPSFWKRLLYVATSHIQTILLALMVLTSLVLVFRSCRQEKTSEIQNLQNKNQFDSLLFLNSRLIDSIQELKSNGSSNIEPDNFKSPGSNALMFAQLELKNGAKSTIPGKYTGPFVKKYNQIAGLGEGYPWAATFVCWCFNHGTTYFKSTGSITQLESFFKKEGQTFTDKITTPMPGDIYFYDWHGKRAVGIVESWDNYSLVGIEGNSSSSDYGPLDQVARVNFKPRDYLANNFVFARVASEETKR
jgi:MinD-like ATPase involved in chromosome partitioning or flagellar assembly